MAEGKNSFILYRDLWESTQYLTYPQAGQLFQHILKYVNDLDPDIEDLHPTLRPLWGGIRHRLKQQLIQYRKRCEMNRESGKKGGAPKGNQNARKQPKTTEGLKKQPKQTDTDTDTDINKKSKPKKVTNVPPPTKEEFMLYLRDDYLKTQPARYQEVRQHMITTFDLWKENGWKDGNDKPIKNWKVKAISQLRYVKPKKR